jgi:hypothetical protein
VKAVGVHVSVLGVTAAGGHEEDLRGLVPASFEAIELRPALHEPLIEHPHRARVAGIRGIRLSDGEPLGVQPCADGLALAQVCLGIRDDTKHLKDSARREIGRISGQVAVEP